MIALIDYDAGNTASVANALGTLGQEFLLTNKEADICRADKIIFPGVGEASFAIKQLHRYNLINLLRIVKKPLLGICLGMQLLSEFSSEGNIACLGVVPGRVEKFDSSKVNVPHMGWNEVFQKKESRLFKDIKDGEFFYFANSYYLPVNEYTTATANHGIDFTAALEKDNFYGIQFHPEKSGDAGLKLLNNFLEL
ncbi:MAG: imidazole glycerol phosphate synthase subunit HisH [Ignavibacteria bacterium]|jgi:glutamine amidotransferase|nr:imidazole glycerol phosphate synthase subunit HisH [Ignavibacteria bacterium]MCU7502018.1 imidazole glycerol phosphate synthase subunit HisH [Ignavibacteria bacterium]MCU7516986.1 imidazole glycerol phosphate synthase subunit HisH [Ignavibacteria bacterium]